MTSGGLKGNPLVWGALLLAGFGAYYYFNRSKPVRVQPVQPVTQSNTTPYVIPAPNTTMAANPSPSPS